MRIFLGKDRRVEIEEAEQFRHTAADAGRMPAEKLRHGCNVLRHSPVRKQAVSLDGVADLAAKFGRRRVHDVLPANEDLSLGDRHQPVDHSHQRRLAGA